MGADATAVDRVLDHLLRFHRVPEALLAGVSDSQRARLRELEEIMVRNRQWRSTSMEILGVSQMLNRSEATESVFSSIVHEARSILNADVCYISLNDKKTATTSILVTAGVNSEEFRSISMPMGTGVLGLVATSKSPVWTSDHLRDPDVSHVPEVDAAVRAEGIRGILGAPLEIGGSTIGALMVADRNPRKYTHDEVSALELLGSITSVALENTQRLEQHHRSVTELTTAQASQTERISVLHRLSEIDHELLSLLAQRLQRTSRSQRHQIADILSHHLDCAAWVWSIDDTPDAAAELSPARAAVQRRCEATTDVVVTEERSGMAVVFNQQVVGGIGIEKEASEFEITALTRAAAVFRALNAFEESVLAATTRKVDDLVHAVALGTVGPEEIRRLHLLTGVDLERPRGVSFVVMHAPHGDSSRREIDALMPETTAITWHDEHMCALHQTDQPLERSLHQLCAYARTERVAIAATALQAREQFSTAHDQAMDYLAAAKALGIYGQIITPANLGSLGLVLGANQRSVDTLVSSTIAPLVDYDQLNSTELETTAYTYLECGHSVTETANQLFIHPNTARQRLERINALLGPHWSVGALSLDVHLALRIRQLAR
ncbi:fused phosphoenolpyruvate-protein phosphotransferase PtsP/GAF domain protein [Corynebacterium ciconiae DSM 44920]|uniref:helix-turn-helix domain-containing protein n=1 Tax=Corynebacterium ciconiae TaxID=227319 RepID=UPI00036C41E8|nr:GAF domain-containing protein [Corynebacterium ciconiae]WKD60376.1 fused phosphoenolpyruvate-protein phosphotransferase PtsP/GAF domain protein [Corynebacterium ciconiae DSM 44920]